jgi:hypothetical protein
MIVLVLHNNPAALLIVYSSFDVTAVDPVDSVREYLLHICFAHIPRLVSQKAKDTCLVTKCKTAASWRMLKMVYVCHCLAGGQDGPDVGCH